jgi:hypothetical protein
MVAPLFRRARTVACLSSSVRPGPGRVSKAEPPPEIRTNTKSSEVILERVEECVLPRHGPPRPERVRGLDHLDSLQGNP